jgi:hypothetical protein
MKGWWERRVEAVGSGGLHSLAGGDTKTGNGAAKATEFELEAHIDAAKLRKQREQRGERRS